MTGRVNAYKFPLDGWSTTGPSHAAFTTRPRNTGWSLRYTDHFTNNDFAAFVYANFGGTAFAACGFHFTTTAHFELSRSRGDLSVGNLL